MYLLLHRKKATERAVPSGSDDESVTILSAIDNKEDNNADVRAAGRYTWRSSIVMASYNHSEANQK